MPVIGVASSPWDDETLRSRARQALEDAGHEIDETVFSRLASNLCYVAGDYRRESTFSEIAGRLNGRTCTVSYLAIPPSLFDDVLGKESAKCVCACYIHLQIDVPHRYRRAMQRHRSAANGLERYPTGVQLLRDVP